jgi:hypothetical protein
VRGLIVVDESHAGVALDCELRIELEGGGMPSIVMGTPRLEGLEAVDKYLGAKGRTS